MLYSVKLGLSETLLGLCNSQFSIPQPIQDYPNNKDLCNRKESQINKIKYFNFHVNTNIDRGHRKFSNKKADHSMKG